MNKLIFCLFALIPFTLMADVEKVQQPAGEFVAPVSPNGQIVETEIDDDSKFNPRKGHWYTTFGFEAMEYSLPFLYVGAKQKFNPEKRQLYGGRLGFGRELYLSKGFMTSTRIEGYYMGTLFESAKTADPTLPDEDVATVKDAGQIFGGDIVQTLSYMWDFKTKNPFMDTWAYLTIEPFIEFGIGKARAFNKKDYSYDTGVVVEEYDQSYNDELNNTKFGGGINMTSRQGYFLYLKATQNRYDISKRRTKGYFYSDGDARANVSANALTSQDPIMVYSLGGGYKF
jgi:hypothetical protein